MVIENSMSEKKNYFGKSEDASGATESKRSKFADKIVEITGMSRENALNELRRADARDIRRSIFFNVHGYEWTDDELDALAFELNQKKHREDDRVSDAVSVITEDLQCSEAEATAILEKCKTYQIKRAWFVENRCYRMTDEELADFADRLDTRRVLVEAARNPDVISEADPRISGLYEYAPPSRKEKIRASIDSYLANISDEEAEAIAREMDFLNVHYGFFFKEYFLYGLRDKTDAERRAFIPNTIRKNYLRKLSTPRGFIICRNKALSYAHLAKFYKRDMVVVSSEADREKLLSFADEHGDFVFKPLDTSFGKGIRKISANQLKDGPAYADEIMSEAPFILEELIIADDRIATLHPASINTIRATTYLHDDGSVTVHLPFFKIGQKGTFVDNGGSGGLFALIDAATGIVITDGKDENNRIYEKHPDTGVVLKGYQVPRWQELLDFAAESARAFPDVRYAGWDMALSADRGWMVVEVNCRTQFYGQQMCDEIGKKDDFEALIGWDTLCDSENEFEEVWEKIDRY